MSVLKIIFGETDEVMFYNEQDNEKSGRYFLAEVIEDDKVVLTHFNEDKPVEELVRQTPYVPFFEGWKRRNPQAYNTLWMYGAGCGTLGLGATYLTGRFPTEG